MEMLREHYRNYDEKAKQIKAEAARTAGFLGMGSDPMSHPAHAEFYNGVGQWVADFLALGPDSAAVLEAARFILGAADERRSEASYWFTFAAQSHVVPMISYMNAGDCKTLADWYDTRYKKLERMPAQRDMYKKLRKAAK